MKYFMTLLFFISLIPSAVSAAAATGDAKPPPHSFTPQKVASLTWGANQWQVALSKAPANNFGPQSFVVDKTNIYLLDSANQRIAIINLTSNTFSSIPLASDDAEDLCILENNHFYVLLGGAKQISLYNQAGRVIQTFPIKNEITPIGIQCHNKYTGILAAFDGRFYHLNQAPPLKWVPIGAYTFSINRDNALQWTVQLRHSSTTLRQAISVKSRRGSVELVNIIGIDNHSNLYLTVEELADDGLASERVFRTLRKYTLSGEWVADVELPYSLYAYTLKDFFVTPSGDVFQILPLKDSFEVIQWHESRSGDVKMMGVNNAKYQKQLFSYLESQPEDFYPSETPGEDFWMSQKANSKMTRQAMIDNAKKYVVHQFKVGKSNITGSRGIYDENKLIITPIAKSGTYTGIPYKWGGNDTLSAFDKGLKAGKKAGDKCAVRCSGGYVGSSRAVGIDCSGYISQVWGLTRKYSTRNLPRISTQLDSMNDLQPGDIINKSGHVRLFSHRDNTGRFFVYEASSRGWKVSGRVYRLSKLKKDGYKPYRYKGIIDKQPVQLYIYGDKSIAEQKSSAYTAKVSYSDGSKQEVTGRVKWYENSQYSEFRGSTLYTQSVNQDETVSVKASYTENGKPLLAQIRVTIRQDKATENTTTTRQEIIDKAKAYANYRFYVSKSNITSRAGIDDGKQKVIITPISSPGYYIGIPYKWGGNNSLVSFQQGLKAGKKAGDICTPKNFSKCQNLSVSSQAVGVDTSGFISQVWGLKHKYSTSNLPKVSVQLDSLNDLQPGDILLKPGKVMLFQRKSDARFYVYEVSNKQWKVTMSSYTLPQLLAYKSYRYKELSSEKRQSTPAIVYQVAVRLAELGYFKEPLKQARFETTIAALKAFQRNIGVAPSGNLDKITLNKLRQVKLSRARRAELEAAIAGI